MHVQVSKRFYILFVYGIYVTYISDFVNFFSQMEVKYAANNYPHYFKQNPQEGVTLIKL